MTTSTKIRTAQQLTAVATYAWYHDAQHVDVNLQHEDGDVFYYQVRNGVVSEIKSVPATSAARGSLSIRQVSPRIARHVTAQLAAHVNANGYHNTPRELRNNYPRRMWVNQPSTLQPMHALHGTNVIAVRDTGGWRVYYLSGETISSHAPEGALSEGWRETASTLTRPVSEAAARAVLQRLRDDAQALHVRLEALIGDCGGELAVLRLYKEVRCALSAAADLREALDF